jgi:PAS domain S-box-containing protein
MPPQSVESFFKSESRYRMLVENSCDIIFSLALDGTFTYVSPAWGRVLGHEASEVLGHSFREFVHPEDHVPYEAAIRSSSLTNSKMDVTCRIHHTDGSWRWHTSRGLPHVDENGVMTVIGMSHDITERLRIEEIMTQTEKMIMVSGMAAGLAHEINNPLGAILQHAQNIERRVSADIPANLTAADEVGVSLDLVRAYLQKRGIFEFIAYIRTAGLRASGLISNMLHLSTRSNSGAAYVHLAALLDRTVALAGSDYDMKKKYNFSGIDIQRFYAADLPPVLMVEVELEQVLLNILANAAQAMAGAGMTRSPQIVLRTRQCDEMVVIEIEDNGPGMDEATRGRIFEPFFTTKDVGIGTGLGLPVAYAIVTKGHHGLIEVMSQPGKGSCFAIKLPLQRIA